MDDFSGREYQDQYIAMMGVPHTPDEHLAVAEKRLEFERNSGPGRFAEALPYVAPFGALLLGPGLPVAGLVLGSSPFKDAAAFDSGTIALLEQQVGELREQKKKADELWAQGLRPGDPEYDKINERVSVLTARVNTAVELHRAQVDATTDIITNIVTAVVTVVVIALDRALAVHRRRVGCGRREPHGADVERRDRRRRGHDRQHGREEGVEGRRLRLGGVRLRRGGRAGRGGSLGAHRGTSSMAARALPKSFSPVWRSF